MLTKQQFALLMTKWQIAEEKIDRANTMLYELFGGDCFAFTDEMEDLVCDVMMAAMNDVNEWIPYFAYERGFDLGSPCVYDDTGEEIKTDTWVDVYNLILNSNRPEEDDEDGGDCDG